jgi:hypothetical protein
MAATNAQKTPYVVGINQHSTRSNQNAIQRLGKTYPCSVIAVTGSIVKVKFEITDPTLTLPPPTMPVFGPEYIRYPIQVGCKGMAIAADAFLGQMSGLGTGIATFAQPPNLSALMFMPFGNLNWPATDPNTLVLYGASNGTLIGDSINENATIAVTSTAITLSCGGHSIVINSTGVIIDGKVFLTHQHTGVQSGSGDTGGVL